MHLQLCKLSQIVFSDRTLVGLCLCIWMTWWCSASLLKSRLSICGWCCTACASMSLVQSLHTVCSTSLSLSSWATWLLIKGSRFLPARLLQSRNGLCLRLCSGFAHSWDLPTAFADLCRGMLVWGSLWLAYLVRLLTLCGQGPFEVVNLALTTAPVIVMPDHCLR